MKKTAFIATMIFGASIASVSAETCRDTCASTPGLCLRISDPENSTSNANLRESIGILYSELDTFDDVEISATVIMSIFGLSSDPCDRSSTKVEFAAPEDGGTTTKRLLYNEGSECRIRADVSLPSGRSLSAGVLVPEILQVDVSDEVPFFVMTPHDGAQDTFAFFSLSSFQDDFGGKIKELAFGPSAVFFTTANGCIELRY